MKKTVLKRTRHYQMLGVAAMVVTLYGVVMSAAVFAQGADMYLDPQEQTVAEGESFEVEIRVDAGEEGVNAAGALLEYPADTFELNEININNSDFEVEATEETDQGSVEIVRGSTESKSGDLLLASLSFTMTRQADSAAIMLSEAESNVVRESDNTDVLGHTSSAAFGEAPDISAHVTEDEDGNGSGDGNGDEDDTQMMALLAAGGALALLIIVIVVGLVLKSRNSGNGSLEAGATKSPSPEPAQTTTPNQDEQASSAPAQPGQQVKPGSKPPNDETKE